MENTQVEPLRVTTGCKVGVEVDWFKSPSESLGQRQTLWSGSYGDSMRVRSGQPKYDRLRKESPC